MVPKLNPNRFRYACRCRRNSRDAFGQILKTISAIVAASAKRRQTLPYRKTQWICNIFKAQGWRATVPAPSLDHTKNLAENNRKRSQNWSWEPPRALFFGRVLPSAVWTQFWTKKTHQKRAQNGTKIDLGPQLTASRPPRWSQDQFG